MIYEILSTVLYFIGIACLFAIFDLASRETVKGKALKIVSLGTIFCLGIMAGGVALVLVAFVVGFLVGDWRRLEQEEKFYLFIMENILPSDKVLEKPSDSDGCGSLSSNNKSEAPAELEQPENLVLAEIKQDAIYKSQLRQAISSRLESLNWSRNGQDVEDVLNP